MKQENTFECLGIPIDYVNHKSVREKIVSRLQQYHGIDLIATVNAEFLVYAHHNSRFKKVLCGAWLRARDGSGIRIAGALTTQPVPEKIMGVTLVEDLTKLASKQGYRVGFLGGTGASAQITLELFQKKYHNLNGWADTGPIIEIDESHEFGLTKKSIQLVDSYITNYKKQLQSTQILFVGFGMPKQEYFIDYLHQKSLISNHGMIAVGVGGSFDEIVGSVPQCPKWISNIGMKWAFRLLTQPWRWKRQLKLFEFVWLLVINH